MLNIFVSDAWLAPWIFFVFIIVWNDSARRVQYAKHEMPNRNLLQTGNAYQELSLSVITLTTLRRKIIQRSIFFGSDLLSSSGFLRE